MFKHILVPVDGSSTSLKAVDKAADLAKAFGSNVTVMSVIDHYPFTGVGVEFGPGQDQFLATATAIANQAIHAAQAAFSKAGVKAESLVVESDTPHRGILEAAAGQGADLIVMGSHGRRGLEKLVLGSVTQRVLGAAHLPVLVVRD